MVSKESIRELLSPLNRPLLTILAYRLLSRGKEKATNMMGALPRILKAREKELKTNSILVAVEEVFNQRGRTGIRASAFIVPEGTPVYRVGSKYIVELPVKYLVVDTCSNDPLDVLNMVMLSEGVEEREEIVERVTHTPPLDPPDEGEEKLMETINSKEYFIDIPIVFGAYIPSEKFPWIGVKANYVVKRIGGVDINVYWNDELGIKITDGYDEEERWVSIDVLQHVDNQMLEEAIEYSIYVVDILRNNVTQVIPAVAPVSVGVLVAV